MTDKADYKRKIERPKFYMIPDFSPYERIVIGFSGGKDSLACLLAILDASPESIHKIELWHHLIDGRSGGGHFMDWPITESYCRAVANHFGIPIYFSWKDGGFKREMLRDQAPTAKTYAETPPGIVSSGGDGPNGTRLKFPQVSANLSVRWCSAYLKIDVASSALRADKRFEQSKTLFITGERAEESPSRAKYASFEVHRADRRNGKKARHIDHWRPVHHLGEKAVWDLIRKYRINPHPAYHLGFGRTSCMKCIFGNDDQWATSNALDPDGTEKLMYYEGLFGCTIHRVYPIKDRIKKGVPYSASKGPYAKIAMMDHYEEPILLTHWDLPPGAFGDSCGPS